MDDSFELVRVFPQPLRNVPSRGIPFLEIPILLILDAFQLSEATNDLDVSLGLRKQDNRLTVC